MDQGEFMNKHLKANHVNKQCYNGIMSTKWEYTQYIYYILDDKLFNKKVNNSH